jgi:hypothetical protein
VGSSSRFRGKDVFGTIKAEAVAMETLLKFDSFERFRPLNSLF